MRKLFPEYTPEPIALLAPMVRWELHRDAPAYLRLGQSTADRVLSVEGVSADCEGGHLTLSSTMHINESAAVHAPRRFELE